MYIINIKSIVRLAALFSMIGLALVSTSVVRADDGIQPPDLPSNCGNLQVPAGNKVFSKTYAIGVQVYRWNGANWSFVAPEANLYANAGFNGKIGTHYAGPTWESNSGSTVVGTVQERCTPDSTAIPWLLLQAVSTDGAGIFRRVTYIQRVNTVGGLVPATPGSTIGAEARIPYTTEYYFYRAE